MVNQSFSMPTKSYNSKEKIIANQSAQILNVKHYSMFIEMFCKPKKIYKKSCIDLFNRPSLNNIPTTKVFLKAFTFNKSLTFLINYLSI